MSDCTVGKELKQSTCRYVKNCKPGFTRNDKFICRKTSRRVNTPDSPKPQFPVINSPQNGSRYGPVFNNSLNSSNYRRRTIKNAAQTGPGFAFNNFESNYTRGNYLLWNIAKNEKVQISIFSHLKSLCA